MNILGGFIFGYAIVGINSSLVKILPGTLSIPSVNASSWKLPLLLASINVGGFLGSAIIPILSLKLTSTSMIKLGCTVSFFASLSMLCTSYLAHFFGRLITGVGIGIISTVCPALVAQRSPIRHRGALSGLFQVSIAFGILAAAILSHCAMGDDRDLATQEFFLTVTDYSLLKFRLRVLLIPMLGAPVGLLFTIMFAEFHKLQLHTQSKTNSSSNIDSLPQKNELSPLKMWELRYPLAIVLMAAVSLQLTGINAVMYYIFSFLEALQIRRRSLGAVFIMCINFSATCIALFITDRVGRRPLLIFGLLAMSASMVLVHIISLYSAESMAMGILAFISLSCYIYGFSIGPGFHFWVICNEILPDAISQKGFAAANIAQWLFLIAITYSFPFLHGCMGNHVFLLFSVISLSAALFFSTCLPETKGIRRETIENLWKS